MGSRGRAPTLPLVLIPLALLTPLPALGQEPSDVARQDEREAAAQAPAGARGRQRPAPARTRLWSAELALSGIYDSDYRRDEDELDRQGLVLGALGRYQNKTRRPTVRLEYGARVRRVSTTARPSQDRVSHSLRASYEWRLDDRWSLETVGTAALRIVTTEFGLADDYAVMPRLWFRQSPKHRHRLFAAYRLREYRDAAGSQADSPFAGYDYRYLVRRGEYWEIGYQYEDNRADVDRFRFVRSTLRTAYTIPLGERDRLRLGLSYRDERYAGRALPEAPDVTLEDHKWVVSALWTRQLTEAARLQLGYNFRTRESNGPGRDFESNRLTTSLRYQW